MATRSCLITLEPDGLWLRVAFSYRLEDVEALKRQIPHPDREWHERGHY